LSCIAVDHIHSFRLCVGLRNPVSYGLYGWRVYPVVLGSFSFTPGIDCFNGFLLFSNTRNSFPGLCYYSEVLNSPITVFMQPKGHTVSDCTNCGVIGSNPSQEMDGWMDGWTVAFVFLFAFPDRAYAIARPVPPFMELLYIAGVTGRRLACRHWCASCIWR
jgi:hypothetical protein